MNRELNIIIGITSLWCFGIIAAPLYAGSVFSDVLYKSYSTICHQFISRSFFINGEPFTVCIRCTSIYCAFLTALIALRIWPRLRNMQWNTSLLIAVASFPMLADGMLSLFGISEATSLSRLLTGSIFGAGMALLLQNVLCETIRSIILGLSHRYEPETR
ncbi:MAG: DUF2085 domain-containing protein [Bacteriovoracaceae bacterium]